MFRLIRHSLLLLGILGLAGAVALATPEQKKDNKKSNSKKEAKASAGDAEKGEAVFKANCAVCHYPDKTEKRIGPGLQRYFKREKMESGKPVNEENTREIIMEGRDKMIPFKEKLDSKQIDDVIAYLKTL